MVCLDRFNYLQHWDIGASPTSLDITLWGIPYQYSRKNELRSDYLLIDPVPRRNFNLWALTGRCLHSPIVYGFKVKNIAFFDLLIERVSPVYSPHSALVQSMHHSSPMTVYSLVTQEFLQ